MAAPVTVQPGYGGPPAYSAVAGQPQPQIVPAQLQNTDKLSYSHSFRPTTHSTTCPTLAFTATTGRVLSPVFKIGTQIECTLSTAFVSLECVYDVGLLSGLAYFELPQTHRSVVTDCIVSLNIAQNGTLTSALCISSLLTPTRFGLSAKGSL